MSRHTRVVIALFVLTGLLALLIGVSVGAPVASPPPLQASFPVIPEGTPILGQSPPHACPNGVYIVKTVYDTDPGGDGGVMVWTRLDDQSTVIMLIRPSSGAGLLAYIRVAGRVVQIPMVELLARYPTPCDVLGMRG